MSAKVIGVIAIVGLKTVTRQAPDMTVRTYPARQDGTMIEADMLANGRGSIRIEQSISGREGIRIDVDPEKDEATLEQRVRVSLGNVSLSIADIRELWYTREQYVTPEECDSWTDYKARREEWARQVDHNRKMLEA